MPTITTTVTINQSAFVSATVNVANAITPMGLWVPTVTSGQMFLQGAADTTSASFVRLQNSTGAGDWTFGVGPGSKAVTLQDVAIPFSVLRLESSVAQANTVAPLLTAKMR